MATRINSEHLELTPSGYPGDEDSGCDIPTTYRGVRDEWARYSYILPDTRIQLYRDFLKCIRSYTWVDAEYMSYTDLDNRVFRYDDLMDGEANYPGGSPQRPVGSGFEFGVVDGGVERWVTSTEGVVDSANWEVVSENPALLDGTWALDVRGNGREITISATLVGDRVELTQVLRELAGTMTAPPRVGWLTWYADDGDKQISVALSAPTKSRWTGAMAAEVQMSLLGVDLGSAGSGVHWEGESLVVTPGEVTEKVEIGGMVPTYPVIRFIGPIGAGSLVYVDGFGGVVQKDIPLGSIVTADCRTKQMWLDDTPDRSYIRWEQPQWPLASAPISQMRTVIEPIDGQSGSIRVEVTQLW